MAYGGPKFPRVCDTGAGENNMSEFQAIVLNLSNYTWNSLNPSQDVFLPPCSTINVTEIAANTLSAMRAELGNTLFIAAACTSLAMVIMTRCVTWRGEIKITKAEFLVSLGLILVAAASLVNFSLLLLR